MLTNLIYDVSCTSPVYMLSDLTVCSDWSAFTTFHAYNVFNVIYSMTHYLLPRISWQITR